MKRTAIAAYLSIPAIFAIGIFVVALSREPSGIEMFSAYVVGGYLFYAAPYLLWAVIAALAGFSVKVWHAGLIASSLALAAISVFWFFPGDRSGFPIQWMLYWPLAIALQTVVAVFTAIFIRTKQRERRTNAAQSPSAVNAKI